MGKTKILGSGGISPSGIYEEHQNLIPIDTLVDIGKYKYLKVRPPLIPIGGRVFYDNGSNGATYKFYDATGNEITNTSISGLANAKYYTIVGTPTKDRWYVYDNSTHAYSGKTANSGLIESIYWGYYNTSTGVTSDGIGKGKTNTDTILNMGVPTDYTPNIWGYIKDMRDNNYAECNDWYIGSKAEIDKLRTSGLVNWFSSKDVWTCVDYSSTSAYYWYQRNQEWRNYANKNAAFCAVALRSF